MFLYARCTCLVEGHRSKFRLPLQALVFIWLFRGFLLFDVLSGEAVQLPSYALLLDAPVDRLDYLEFTREQTKEHTCSQGKELQQLLCAVEQRLTQLDEGLREGAALPIPHARAWLGLAATPVYTMPSTAHAGGRPTVWRSGESDSSRVGCRGASRDVGWSAAPIAGGDPP